MSTSGDAARAFMTLISVCPPASARAPSCSERRRTASWTLAGRAYSTSRRSMVYSVQKALHSSRKYCLAQLVLQPLVLGGDLTLQLRQTNETIVISLDRVVLRLRHVRLARKQ